MNPADKQNYMECFARFGIICTIQKTWKAPMEECQFELSCRLKPVTLLKVTLIHGCFSRFSNYTNGTKLRKASNMDKVNPTDISVFKVTNKNNREMRWTWLRVSSWLAWRYYIYLWGMLHRIQYLLLHIIYFLSYMLKYYIPVSVRQFTNTLNQFFQSPSANGNL